MNSEVAHPGPTALPTLGLLAATAVWGATFVTVKDALAASDTFTFLFLRFSVGALAAALLAVAIAPWAPVEQRGFSLALLRPGLVLGGLLFGGYALQTLGLETTTPARSAFITGLTVIFVPFVSWRLDQKRPPVRAFVAPLVAVVGLQQLTGVSWSSAIPVGDALTLGCALFYAGHIALVGRFAKGLPALPLTAVQLGVVSLLSAATLPLVTRRFVPTTGFVGAVLFTGVVASALAIGIQAWAQRRLSAVRAAVIYSLEPVFALSWALVTGLGWPSAPELVGGVFILGAVLISEVEFKRST